MPTLHNLIDLILLCSTLFLAAICLLMFLGRVKQKKKIFESIAKTKSVLSEQYTQDETRLKSISGAFLTDELQFKITEIISVEKINYQNLMALFLDYHPAAIEMLPSLMNNVIASYTDCIQYIVLHSKMSVPAEEVPKEVEQVEEGVDDENFQYEALIEQLRHEKQDFADKYKNAQNLINKIYLKYKDTLEVDNIDATTGMSLDDIAKIFKV